MDEKPTEVVPFILSTTTVDEKSNLDPEMKAFLDRIAQAVSHKTIKAIVEPAKARYVQEIVKAKEQTTNSEDYLAAARPSMELYKYEINKGKVAARKATELMLAAYRDGRCSTEKDMKKMLRKSVNKGIGFAQLSK